MMWLLVYLACFYFSGLAWLNTKGTQQQNKKFGRHHKINYLLSLVYSFLLNVTVYKCVLQSCRLLDVKKN